MNSNDKTQNAPVALVFESKVSTELCFENTVLFRRTICTVLKPVCYPMAQLQRCLDSLEVDLFLDTYCIVSNTYNTSLTLELVCSRG